MGAAAAAAASRPVRLVEVRQPGAPADVTAELTPRAGPRRRGARARDVRQDRAAGEARRAARLAERRRLPLSASRPQPPASECSVRAKSAAAIRTIAGQ